MQGCFALLVEQFLRFRNRKWGVLMRSFISTFCVFAPLFTYFIPCDHHCLPSAQALGNSLANKTFRTPGFLRWILALLITWLPVAPSMAMSIAGRLPRSTTLAPRPSVVVSSPWNSWMRSRSSTTALTPAMADAKMSVIVDGKKVVYSLSPEKVKAIQAANPRIRPRRGRTAGTAGPEQEEPASQGVILKPWLLL